MPLKILNFYLEGFRGMRVGRTLWKLILVKLLVIFALLKLFFPDVLKVHYDNDTARADHVLERLTQTDAAAKAGK